ncbi:MAG: hypothetical protein AAFO07_07875, partial [Bacteroidota bacterium]
MIQKFTFLLLFSFLFCSFSIAQVSQVNLVFTPMTGGGAPIQAGATDSGNGLQVNGPISLDESTEYSLVINLTDQTTNYNNLRDEIQFFIIGSEGAFRNNISLDDADTNSLPVGFLSTLNTECTEANTNGTLRIALRNLGNAKAANSMITDGTGVFDLSWDVTIIDDTTAPSCENEEEVITDVILSFIPASGGDTIRARAQDPDGEGVLDLEVLDEINLNESESYELQIELLNTVADEV